MRSDQIVSGGSSCLLVLRDVSRALMRFLATTGAVQDAVALVARLDDVAVMGQAIEQRGRHLRVAEHARTLCEVEAGDDHHAGVFVEATQQMEEQCASGLLNGR